MADAVPVIIRNVSRGTALASRVETANGLWAKFMGLMGRPTLRAEHALWLPDSNGIHMMFMRFPIDAVFLTRDLRVVRVVENLRPWRLARARGARRILELGAGEARRLGIVAGDRLQLEAA